MAGTALRRVAKHFPFVKQGLLLNVSSGVKIPVKMTTSAVIIDNSVAVCRNKISIKSLFNFLSVTTHTHPNQNQNPKPLHLK
jgi:hypothetical protein